MTSNGKIDKKALLASVGVTASPPSKSMPAPSKPTISHERTISAATTIASVHPGTRVVHRPLLALTASVVTITPATHIRSVFPSPETAILHPETQPTQQPWPLLPPLEKQPMQAPIHPPSTSSSKSSDSTYVEKYQLPEKNGRHGIRALRHRILSLYRRLFSIVFVINLIALILMLKFGKEGRGLENVSVAIGANLATAVLMRQEIVINALFDIACSVPTSAPMWLRRNCAKVYHIGGLHSGCAVASTFWLILFTVAATVEYRDPAVLVISYLLVLLLIGMVGSAHPTIRMKYHDHFELIHRFAGWTALILFWVQTVVVTNSFRDTQPIGHALAVNPAFWLLLIATLSVILPWLNLRKVTVRADVLSPHAVRLYFTYTSPVVGTAIRLSERPLIEWHAFATIAKPNSNEFSVLVSNAGDWTKRQITTAPTKLWVRGVPACGVLRITPLFKSVVLVATGSGIGPCLPVIYAKKVPARIFWSTPHPEQNFGTEVSDAVRNADPDAVIHNTKTDGRPDMVAITYRLLRESGAEAVCIISNKKLTQMVVYAMEARGIPAFGAIFDS